MVEGDVRDAGLVARAIGRGRRRLPPGGADGGDDVHRDPASDFDVNIRGTLNVLEAARAPATPADRRSTRRRTRCTATSRISEIVEETTRYVLPELPYGIAETAALEFTSPYACSKGAADQYVARPMRRRTGCPAVVLRQSCIYGPRQMGVEDQGWAAWLVLAGAAGVPATIYGDGKQVRDLLYVEDLVDAYLAAARSISATSGRAYNIGGGPAFAVSIWQEFAQILRRRSGRRRPTSSSGLLGRATSGCTSATRGARRPTSAGLRRPRPVRDSRGSGELVVPAAPALRELLVDR